jgi:hypothetical protein
MELFFAFLGLWELGIILVVIGIPLAVIVQRGRKSARLRRAWKATLEEWKSESNNLKEKDNFNLPKTDSNNLKEQSRFNLPPIKMAKSSDIINALITVPIAIGVGVFMVFLGIKLSALFVALIHDDDAHVLWLLLPLGVNVTIAVGFAVLAYYLINKNSLFSRKWVALIIAIGIGVIVVISLIAGFFIYALWLHNNPDYTAAQIDELQKTAQLK